MKKSTRIRVIIIGILIMVGIAGLFWCKWYLLVCNCNIDCKTEMILFWIGCGASFMASLLAKDQNDRLKNSTFGGLVGTGLSALVTIVQKQNNIDYILYSVYGSVFGTFFGWLVYACIAVMAYIRYNSPLSIIELITNGLQGIREQIISEENKRLLGNLDIWWKQFAMDFEDKATILLKFDYSTYSKEMMISIVKSLLTSVCKVHNLMYNNNQMRASIIKFDANQFNGKHWINYADFSNPLDMKIFDHVDSSGKKIDEKEKESVAHKLLVNENEIYKYVDTKNNIDIQDRKSEKRYRYFSLFKIDDRHILTLDWPDDINKINGEMTRDYFLDPRIIDTLKNLFAKFDA